MWRAAPLRLLLGPGPEAVGAALLAVAAANVEDEGGALVYIDRAVVLRPLAGQRGPGQGGGGCSGDGPPPLKVDVFPSPGCAGPLEEAARGHLLLAPSGWHTALAGVLSDLGLGAGGCSVAVGGGSAGSGGTALMVPMVDGWEPLAVAALRAAAAADAAARACAGLGVAALPYVVGGRELSAAAAETVAMAEKYRRNQGLGLALTSNHHQLEQASGWSWLGVGAPSRAGSRSRSSPPAALPHAPPTTNRPLWLTASP